MSLIASLFDSVAGGGVLGAVGGIAQSVIQGRTAKFQAEAELAKLKEVNLQEAKRWEHDRAMTELEIKSKMSLAEMDKEKETQLADMNAMMESFKADKPTFSEGVDKNKYGGWLVFVDVWRGLIRPAITTYWSMMYTILAGYVTYQIFVNYPSVIDKTWLSTQMDNIVVTVGFISSTVTLWWFAARAQQGKK